jgi:hypothetical protein
MPMIKGPALYNRNDGALKDILWHDIVIIPEEMIGGSKEDDDDSDDIILVLLRVQF